MRIGRILTLLALLLAPALVRAQGVEVDYTHPQKYTIAGIEVEGNTYFADQQIISQTGLRPGMQVTVPGDDISNVVRRLWLQRFFEDVSVEIDSLNAARDSAWFRIKILERPRMSRWSFTGVKSGERKDLEERLTLRLGEAADRILKLLSGATEGVAEACCEGMTEEETAEFRRLLGRAEPGDLMMILGTSGCHILVGDALRCVPGICGVVDGGILPGMIGYEAGQSCVGDMFAWYVDHGCPAYVHEAARAGGMDAHRWLTDRAARLRPGESGLMALDWWNGNRSVLADAGLTGLMLGMTLSTRPEEIYRALIEATAYGTRVILENFERNGVPVKRVFACGGIARKNPLLLRIYADVLDREISVVRTSQAGALGSAIFAAAAAGLYPSVAEAAGRMGGAGDEVSAPETDNVRIYDALYREYLALHDHFGRGGSDAMKRLRRIREAACRFTP